MQKLEPVGYSYVSWIFTGIWASHLLGDKIIWHLYKYGFWQSTVTTVNKTVKYYVIIIHLQHRPLFIWLFCKLRKLLTLLIIPYFIFCEMFCTNWDTNVLNPVGDWRCWGPLVTPMSVVFLLAFGPHSCWRIWHGVYSISIISVKVVVRMIDRAPITYVMVSKITHLYFFLLGFLKFKVYASQCHSVQELRPRNTDVCNKCR